MFFWNSLAFLMIQQMLAIWSLVPLPFLKPAWTYGSSRFMYCWSLAWRILSITLLVCEWSESHSVMSDSLGPHRLYSPWNSPDQNTGVGSLSLLQQILPTQESYQGRLHYRQILYKLSYQEYASKFGKLISGHRTGKGQFSFQSQRKAMPKNAQTISQFYSSHTLAK